MVKGEDCFARYAENEVLCVGEMLFAEPCSYNHIKMRSLEEGD